MYTINIDKVVQLICMYAHLPLSRRGEASELAESAAAYLSSALVREPRTPQEETACIHAAACLALCDLARIGSSGFEQVVTEAGSFTSQGKSSITVEAAEKLKADALERLGDMYTVASESKHIDDFYFEGVDG